jgi:hypothetical protein
MNRVTSFLSNVWRAVEWREIASAPFDREIELAVIDGEVSLLGGSCLRHGEGWLDAETLMPVAVTATHWRYRRPALLPMSCC